MNTGSHGSEEKIRERGTITEMKGERPERLNPAVFSASSVSVRGFSAALFRFEAGFPGSLAPGLRVISRGLALGDSPESVIFPCSDLAAF